MNPGPADNPFAAPGAPIEAPPPTGSLEVGRCFREGWQRARPQLGVWAVMMMALGGAVILSGVTIIGIFVVWPVLMWGYIRFNLDSFEGHAEWRTAFAGFSNYGQSLGAMLVLGILMALADAPGQIPGYLAELLGLALGEDSLVVQGVAVVGGLFSLVWTFVVTNRLGWAWYYAVDQGTDPVTSMKASWAATQGQLGAVTGFILICIALLFGGFFLPPLLGLFVACPVTGLAAVSGYHQLRGESPAAPSAL